MKKGGTGSPIVIIGAGMAGLRAAQILHEHSRPFLIFEADSQPGGRIQTQYLKGFRLDKGFQVLQPSYPEVKRSICLKNLQLRHFAPGALVWDGNCFWRVCDPFRQPWGVAETLLAPIGTFRDKILIARLRQKVLSAGEEGVWNFPRVSTLEYLKDFGFSQKIISRFFLPFLAGVFLEPDLETPANQFAYVYRHFSLERVAIPAMGMGSIAQEMIRDFPSGSFRFDTRVVRVFPRKCGIQVELESGETLLAQSVVMAGPANRIQDLFGEKNQVPRDLDPPFRSATTHWFASPGQIKTGPFLILDGTGSGPVTHAAVLSEVAPEYAPEGHSLIALNCVGKKEKDSTPELAQAQARIWWGPRVDDWRFLQTHRISRALPMTRNMPEGPPRPDLLDSRIHLAGDHTTHPSLEGALVSGKRAAIKIIK